MILKYVLKYVIYGPKICPLEYGPRIVALEYGPKT